MAEPFEATDNNFEAEVLQSETPVLIDFWADWCGPCRVVAPHVKSIAEEYGESLRVGKMDVDDNPAVPGRYGIMSIPTLLLFKDGKVVQQIVGAQPKDRIVAQILPYLN